MTEGGELIIAIKTDEFGDVRIGVGDGDDELDAQRFWRALNNGGVRVSVLEWEPLNDGR